MTITRLQCDRLWTGTDEITDGELIIRDDRIVSVSGQGAQRPRHRFGNVYDPAGDDDFDNDGGFDEQDDVVAEVSDGWVVPGFVDTHVHGGGGADLAATDPGTIRQALTTGRRAGATSSFASLVTAGIDVLCAQLQALAPFVDDGEIAGIHLEGPFLAEARCGAQNPAFLRDPDPVLIDRLLSAADGRLSMITLAPELPGALDAIARLTDAGVTVAIGHTDADAETIARAVDSGATVATHLFNGMPPTHHRIPGPVPRLLADHRVLTELICDGFHLHPDVIAMAVSAAGTERVGLITDAMSATGMPDGSYRLGQLDVTVREGQARLRADDAAVGSIAGSTLTMAAAVAYCVQQVGLPVPDVARMAATTPARWHQLDQVGALEPGRRADLVVLDGHGSTRRVMRRGTWLEER